MKIGNYKLEIALALIIFCSFGLNSAKAALILQHPNYTGLNQGLVGFWSFDGNTISGTSVVDLSGQGNNGTLTNGPTRVKGKLGQALSFDGVDDYVNVLDAASLDPSQITISSWVYISSSFHWGDIVEKSTNLGYRYRINVDKSVTWFDRGATNNISSISKVSTGTWTNIVVMGDSSGLKIYINGNLDKSNSTAYGSPRNSGHNLHIGADIDQGEYLGGSIDDVRIYNRALNQDEIKRLYRIGGTLHVNTQINTDSLQKGLVGWWTFDGADMNATKALDKSGQGNNGTLTNGPTRVKGKLGQALNFDGVNDFVDAVNSSSLNITGNISISAWVYPRSLLAGGVPGRIVDKGTILNSTYIFALGNFTAGGLTSGLLWGTNVNAVSNNNVITLNQWQHVVVVEDGTNVSFYVNGIKVGVSAASNPGDNSGNSLSIGNRPALDRAFDGLIDDVRIYNHALSADEIKRLYKIGGTVHVNTPINTDTLQKGLVGYWSFDGPTVSGTSVADLSGQGNNGTLTNGPTITKGKLGQALSFNASTKYILMANESNFDFNNTDKFSGCAWIYPNKLTDTTHRIFYKGLNGGDSGLQGFMLYTESTNKLSFEIVSDFFGGNYVNVSSPVSSLASTQTWYHTCFTYDGSSSAAGIKLYINGISQTLTVTLDALSGSILNNRQFQVSTNSAAGFNGSIDDVRIYNRVLTADEIKRLYNLGH